MGWSEVCGQKRVEKKALKRQASIKRQGPHFQCKSLSSAKKKKKKVHDEQGICPNMDKLGGVNSLKG